MDRELMQYAIDEIKDKLNSVRDDLNALEDNMPLVDELYELQAEIAMLQAENDELRRLLGLAGLPVSRIYQMSVSQQIELERKLQL